MTSRAEILDFLRENQDLFRTKYQISKIGLFGSFARKEQNSNSDIDLIFEFDKNASNLFQSKEEIREMVGLRFGTKIDLCREKYIKSFFKDSILRDAIYI